MAEKVLTKKIRAIEDRFRLLFNNPNDVIWVLDLEERKFIYVSNEIKNILGYLPEEAKALPPERICTESCIDNWSRAMEQERVNYEKGEHRTMRLQSELLKKDGSLVLADVDWRLFRETGGLRAIGILRDPASAITVAQIESDLGGELKEILAERDRLRWEVKILQGLLPICANCKKIRDSQGNWRTLEEYVASHSEADFTHTICPPCERELYPELGGADGDP